MQQVHTGAAPAVDATDNQHDLLPTEDRPRDTATAVINGHLDPPAFATSAGRPGHGQRVQLAERTTLPCSDRFEPGDAVPEPAAGPTPRLPRGARAAGQHRPANRIDSTGSGAHRSVVPGTRSADPVPILVRAITARPLFNPGTVHLAGYTGGRHPARGHRRQKRPPLSRLRFGLSA